MQQICDECHTRFEVLFDRAQHQHGAWGTVVPPKGSTEGLFGFQLQDETANQGAGDIVPT